MSDYPKKIDGSASLPLVRNNIVEAGADTINKIREAVINIERALGIEPQGAMLSLSDRISKSIDENGEIKNSAISKLNVISGPIVNSDVDQAAKISESKLDLDYSTQYLKSEIISLISEVSHLVLQISNIKSSLEVHISGSGAHKASSIDVDYIAVSNTSSSNLTASNNLQGFLSNFINSHVSFSGGATLSSKSHTSDQIYADTTLIDGVEGENLQEVIESLANKDAGSYENIIHNYIGSHYPKSSVVGSRGATDEVSDRDIKVSFNTYNGNSGEKGSEVFIPDGDELSASLGDFILVDDQKYIISQINYSSGKSVSSIFADGFYPSRSQTIFTNFIYKKKDDSNEFGLNISRIRKTSGSPLEIFQIVNPYSATISAENTPRYGDMLLSNTLTIETDIQTYNISYSNKSNIFDLAVELNDFCISNGFPILFSQSKGFLIVSNLIIKSSSYLKIVSNGFEQLLGFSPSENIFGKEKRNIVIGRKEYKGLKNIATDIPVRVSGSSIISLGEPFYSYGINTGTSFIINNLRYFVDSISGNNILYSGSLSDGNYTLTAYDDSMYIGSVFGKRTVANIVQHQGSIYYPYLSQDRTLNIHSVVDYNIPYSAQTALVSVEILNMFPENELIEGSIDYDSNTGLFFYLEGLKKRYFSSQKIIVGSKNKVVIEILDASGLRSFLSSPYQSQIQVNSIYKNDFLILGSVNYEANGNIRSLKSFSLGGYLDYSDLSSEYIETEGSYRRKIHKNRVLDGISVLSKSVNSDKYEVEISSGTILVNGKFVDIASQIVTSDLLASSNTKVYISCTFDGIVSISAAGSNCEFNLPISENIPLILLEYISSTLYSTNMSKYHVDYFNGTSDCIYVAEDGSGHCSTLKDAIYLAKKYEEAFDKKITSILFSSGIFKVQYYDTSANGDLSLAYDNGLLIDFPINIIGQGDSTVFDFDVGSPSESIRGNRAGYFHILGPDTTSSELSGIPSASYITEGLVSFKDVKFLNCGVKMKNFTSRNSTQYSDPKVVFENVTFERSDDVNVLAGIYSYSRFDATTSEVYLGNIEVYNCSFNESKIYIDRPYNNIMNIAIKNCKFYNNSEEPFLSAYSGNIKTGISNNNFNFNNSIVGNKKYIKGNNGLITAEGIGYSDFISNKLTASELEATHSMISSAYFKSSVESVFDSSSVLYSDSNATFSGTENAQIPLSFSRKSTDGYSVDLGEGQIKGYEKRHLSNSLYINLTSTTIQNYLFNFNATSFMIGSTLNINDYDSSIRLFADPNFDDGIVVNKVSVYVPMIEENNSARIGIYMGTPPNGNMAYSSITSLANINGGYDYALIPQLLESTDSYTVKTYYPNITVDKESLAFFITIQKDTDSAGNMEPFNLRVELELGVK